MDPIRLLPTNQANQLRADGAPAPLASGPVERVVRAHGSWQRFRDRQGSHSVTLLLIWSGNVIPRFRMADLLTLNSTSVGEAMGSTAGSAP
jgi:hypothetical protein